MLRSDPGRRVPTANAATALQREAKRLERDLEEELWLPLGNEQGSQRGTAPNATQEQERLTRLYRRAQADLDRARRRPR